MFSIMHVAEIGPILASKLSALQLVINFGEESGPCGKADISLWVVAIFSLIQCFKAFLSIVYLFFRMFKAISQS